MLVIQSHRGLQVYSTCRVCHEIMLVIDMLDLAHPCCNPSFQLVEEPVNDNLVAAVAEYASWGWPCFPLAALSKQPAIPKEQGGHGFKDATTDVQRIRRWWDRHPQHNIGVATGHLFDVIDIDPKDGGTQSLTELLAQQRIPTCHAVAKTASGGLHLYIEPRHAKNGAGVKPGVDYRGLGGYVAAAPSTRGAGQTYTWLINPSPIIKAGSK
jgi:Bifunctional DNA primase/polymerase, N-terminal